MKKNAALFILVLTLIATSCKPAKVTQLIEDNKEFTLLLETYFNERMQLFPLESTINGDSPYNNLLPAEFTDSYHTKLMRFFNSYRNSLNTFKREQLNNNDKISFDILKWETDMSIEGLLNHHAGNSEDLISNTYFPFNQFKGVPLLLGQMGGGKGYQPFRTTADYENWLRPANAFSSWTDSTIVYFKK
jgi:uncharacterized protein (DUF885 family)